MRLSEAKNDKKLFAKNRTSRGFYGVQTGEKLNHITYFQKIPDGKLFFEKGENHAPNP